MNKIKFVDPSVTHVEKKNLNKALKGGWLSFGSYVKNLENKICKIIKVKNVPIHLEFIKNAKGLYPIDFAIRGAGSHIYSEILSSIIN